MFPLWLRIIFAGSGILGLLLLIKSISRIVTLYNNPNRVEFSAKLLSSEFEVRASGDYEIAVKRPSLFGIIPHKVTFHVRDLESGTEIRVMQNLNLFSQRKTLSGERVVPVAEFCAGNLGKYELQNLSSSEFKDNDKLVITPKTGAKGFLLIFAILFSAIFFIGGLVMTLLGIFGKQ